MSGGSTRQCPTCGRTAWADATGCAYCKTDLRPLPPVGVPGEPVRRVIIHRRRELNPFLGLAVVALYAVLGLLTAGFMAAREWNECCGNTFVLMYIMAPVLILLGIASTLAVVLRSHWLTVAAFVLLIGVVLGLAAVADGGLRY
jgi:hypothetical protein